MPKKEPVTIKTTKMTVRGTIIVALIGLLGLLIPFFMQYEQVPSSTEMEFIGRVIDSRDQQPIAGAKVTLELQGIPQIKHTDSEGIYRFKVSLKFPINGQVWVDAQGYQTYTRNISLSPEMKDLVDIRLTA